MVVGITPKVKRIRPKLTSAQKASRHDKAVDLSNAINDAREAYREEAATGHKTGALNGLGFNYTITEGCTSAGAQTRGTRSQVKSSQIFLPDDAGDSQHSSRNISKISPLNMYASLHLKRKNSGTMSSIYARTASKLCVQIQRHYKNKSTRCLRAWNKKYVPRKCLFPSLIEGRTVAKYHG